MNIDSSMNKITPNTIFEVRSFIGYFILALLSLSIFDRHVDGLRYLKYATPIICSLVLLVYKFRFYQDDTTRPFIFLFIATMLLAPIGNAYGLHDAYFYLTSLAPFLVGCVPKLNPKRFFLFLAGLFLLLTMPDLLSGGFTYSILDSESSLEDHSFAFVFGLFAIFFFLTKDKKYFFLSLILALLVLKRISLLAISLVIVVYYIFPYALLKRLAIVGLLANMAYIFIAFYITTESFNYLSQEYFGVSSSFLTMGRTALYDPIFSSSRDFISMLFGDGPGSSYSIAAASIFIADGKVNIHSDVLKIYYELGVFVFLAFFFLCYKLRDLRIYLFIYINIILFTDNISTYVIVMYVYFFLAQKLREYESNSAAKSSVVN